MTENRAVPLLPAPWRQLVSDVGYDLSELAQLLEKVTRRRRERTVYPPAGQEFRVLELLSPDDVRVVILGQDPYIGLNQAHGIAFSVPAGTALPPSLNNIFREYQRDLGASTPASGDLTAWVTGGVLLLNTVLTVDAGCSGSHSNWGWERFTDAVITGLAARKPEKVFLLWGNAARRKRQLISASGIGHHLLENPHPSPLSAYRGFFGSSPFSQAEACLPDWHWPRLPAASDRLF